MALNMGEYLGATETYSRIAMKAQAQSRAALEALARTYAAETATTKVRVNLFNPGPTRTRMRAQAFPGEDPMTLEAADKVAEKVVELCLPSVTETGKLYAYQKGRFLDFCPPA